MDLFRNSETVDFPAGCAIFTQGEPGDRMYVLRAGAVELRVGERSLVVLDQEGSLFGEMALLDSGPRSATAVAKTDCRLVPVDRKRFLFLVQNTPFFSLEVMKVMADRLRAMDAARR